MQKSNSAGMVLFLLLVAMGIGWGRPAASARGSDAILTSSIVTQRTWPENLPDDTTTRVNPALRLRRPAEVPPTTHSDRFAPGTISAPRQFQSISQYLATLTPAECRHAKLYFEFEPDFAATARATIQTIVTCWQQGDYAGALQKLKMLENQGGARQLAVGIEWQNPPAFQKPAWGADIRVGTPTNVRAVGLDFDATSQHLFIVTRYQDGNVFYWTMNYSDNNGQSWIEKFRWGSVADLTNVSMTVVSGYCYVGYNLGNAARLRRFSVTTGNPDTGFDYITVFTKSYAITDLALSSNGDGYNDRVYYTAILANQSLVWYIFEPPTTTWYEAATNITDAASGLDASEDAGFATGSTDYYYWFSYLTASNRLHVVRVKNVGANRVLENIELGDAIGGTSISAFHGIIITAYEYNFSNGKGIRYHISYDHGATWYVGTVAEPAAPGTTYYEVPDVTARRDGGIALVYQEESGATDRCWYRTRDYGTGPNSGWSWSSPIQMNEVDVVTGFPLAIEWIPPAPGYGDAYGITWIGGSDVAAYFDRTDILPRQINLTVDQAYCSYSFAEPLLNIQIRVTNNGTLTAGASYLGYYLATSPNELNTYLKIGDDYVPSLSPGSYSDQSLACNISSLGLTNGSYYVCFIVDYQNQVTESNEDDNSWYFTTPIQLQSNWPTTFKLLVPNGNEAWRTGKSQTVIWNCDRYTGQVKVELSTDWGNSWREVPGGSSAVNNGNFSFTPAAGDVGGNCQMRVTSIQNPNASDRTDYKFSIFNAIKHYVAQQVPAEMSEPAIDGHLNDPIWAQINPSELLQFGGLPEDFLSHWTDFADNRVTWRAVWSARTNLLYVAVEIQDDQAGASDHGYDQLWQDDCIEIFTDGNRDGGFFAPANIDAQQWFVRRDNARHFAGQTGAYTGGAITSAVRTSAAGNWVLELAIRIYNTYPGNVRTLQLNDVLGWELWYDDSDNTVKEDHKYVRNHQVGWGYVGAAFCNADAFQELELGPSATVPAWITVEVPNGGEVWYCDTYQTIHWSSQYTSGQVSIELSRNNGSTWENLASSTPDDGYYTWLVMGATTSQARIRITDVDGSPSDVSNNPFTILQAILPDIHVEPSAWNFGNVPVGSYAEKTFVISNPGTATLNGNATTISGANGSEFTITSGGAPFNLDAGATRNLVIRFSPNSAGNKSALLTIHSNDPDENPFNVSLSGTGITLSWEVPINISTGVTANFTRTFGGAANATDGYDPGQDVIVAPPGMTYYPYFSISVIPYYLEKDFRGWVAPYTNSIDWKLVIANATGITTNLSWNSSLLPTVGQFTLVIKDVRINMRTQNTASLFEDPPITIEYRAEEAVRFDFPNQGWFLISLPVTPGNHQLTHLFPTALGAFGYNSATGAYFPVTQLEVKKGYWLLIPGPTSATISGLPFTSYTGHYLPGWHLIGAVKGTNLPFADPDDTPNGAVIAAYGWNQNLNNYQTIYPMGTGVLNEKQGYWLAVAATCDLTIPGVPPLMADAATHPVTNAAFAQQFGSQPPPPPVTAGVDPDPIAAAANRICWNYPNPFNPTTTIQYTLKNSGFTAVLIYNNLGQRIRTLVQSEQTAGVHLIEWDSRNDLGEFVPSGIYFFTIKAADFVATRKMLLMR